jgi:hypothetical protein
MTTKYSLVYCELKKHKQWFDQACSKLVDLMKEGTL